MIPETSINWKAFEYKYSDNPQKAFEELTYYLFCQEFNQANGIFRYFNQPHIETNPIRVENRYIGFQSKYYADSVTMSSKENELTEAVEGASRAYPGITTLYFYISHEFSPSSKRDTVKPAYQTNIESAASKHGIEIVWRGISNINAQLMENRQFTACRNVFFQVNSAVQRCWERLNNHKKDIFDNINTSVLYKENTIILENGELDFENFLKSDNQILLVDGEAGSGKSALVKRMIANVDNKDIFLAFKSTDMDVNDKLKFLTLYGELTIDEVIDIYKEEDMPTLYIDAVEKYFILEYQQTFEEIFDVFIKAGWKVILTIRTAYKEAFYNALLNKLKVQQYHVNSICHDELLELSNKYGFMLPQDRKLLALLCIPFYLKLYLALDNLENKELVVLNKDAFENKIWENIIRQNKKRKDNLPTRREEVITSITMEMLEKETYSYVIKPGDDYEALSGLEQSGVLIQTDDARSYCHSHDVFEELVTNHIFMKQYRNNMDVNQFLAKFHISLRTRKLFRNWLSDFASEKENHEIIFKILENENVNKIWKDEVILTVISTESMKDVYNKLTSRMTDNSCTMLKRIIFLINTCCRVAEHSDIYWSKGNLIPFRLAKPSGYAWESLFRFIENNKNSICWDKELISAVIDVLDSWTKHKENVRGETTEIAGKVGIFLFEEISKNREWRYAVRKEQIEQIQNILLNSAWMIREDLKKIFQTVIDGMVDDQESKKIPYLITMRETELEVPKGYIKLAKCAISDILHYGEVPYAMPKTTIQLMRTLWLSPANTSCYQNVDIDEDFGLNEYMTKCYHPISAYKTPVIGMLQKNPKLMIDFLIEFFNETGNTYLNSYLKKTYDECYKIIIYVKGNKIEQMASDRLWRMYRGTHVGPNLLVSLLMGIEQWLLSRVKTWETKDAVEYCQYILMKSQNVMLTSVIVSIAEAFPEKLFDVVCDILKTKEIFLLDANRFASEKTASFLVGGRNIFEIERLESNKLAHRRKRLENIIFEYQTNKDKVIEQEFEIRRKKLYAAIDEATADIDTWREIYKFAYYRMDLRHYQAVVDVQSDDNGHNIYAVMPDFSEDMKKLSRETQKEYENSFRYADLELWSNNKFNKNENSKKYTKYEDIKVTCKELKEVWSLINSNINNEKEKANEISLNVYRYIAIASYTTAVLFRDYSKDLDSNNKELCENIVFNLGNVFTQASYFRIMQFGNGIEGVTTGLILLVTDENIKLFNNKNPLFLLLKLLFRNWSDDSRVITQIKNLLWKINKCAAWSLIYLFSLLADQYENEKRENRNLSVDLFLESKKEQVMQELVKKSINEASIDFLKVSHITVFTMLSLISPEIKEAAIIAEKTKDIAMKIAFADEEKQRDILGYVSNYVIWFSDVLLYCNDKERTILINSFIERMDILENDNIKDLLIWLINEQEYNGKVAEFWKVWKLLMPSIIKVSNDKPQLYYSDINIPIGQDAIITSYLFANSAWKPDIHECALLPEEKAEFFDYFIDQSKNVKAVLYSIVKLLNTIGKDVYRDKGIEWIYKLVSRDSEAKIILYDNTLYYLEEYMGQFVARHRMKFKINTQLACQTQTILEYMVNQGSQIAFFLREQI